MTNTNATVTADAALPAVRSTDWLEPLAERLERRLSAYKECCTYAMPMNGDEAFRALLTILSQELRACAESGSNAEVRDRHPEGGNENHENRAGGGSLG